MTKVQGVWDEVTDDSRKVYCTLEMYPYDMESGHFFKPGKWYNEICVYKASTHGCIQGRLERRNYSCWELKPGDLRYRCYSGEEPHGLSYKLHSLLFPFH